MFGCVTSECTYYESKTPITFDEYKSLEIIIILYTGRVCAAITPFSRIKTKKKKGFFVVCFESILIDLILVNGDVITLNTSFFRSRYI